jgi:glycosyltransferase involved in cell wall biosynthesis
MKLYNHERHVEEAIKSVLRQDFEDLELIIVDNASTDTSRQITERYAEQDPRIRVIFQECNLGISKVVNDGIDAAPSPIHRNDGKPVPTPYALLSVTARVVQSAADRDERRKVLKFGLA